MKQGRLYIDRKVHVMSKYNTKVANAILKCYPIKRYSTLCLIEACIDIFYSHGVDLYT